MKSQISKERLLQAAMYSYIAIILGTYDLNNGEVPFNLLNSMQFITRQPLCRVITSWTFQQNLAVISGSALFVCVHNSFSRALSYPQLHTTFQL